MAELACAAAAAAALVLGAASLAASAALAGVLAVKESCSGGKGQAGGSSAQRPFPLHTPPVSLQPLLPFAIG